MAGNQLIKGAVAITGIALAGIAVGVGFYEELGSSLANVVIAASTIATVIFAPMIIFSTAIEVGEGALEGDDPNAQESQEEKDRKAADRRILSEINDRINDGAELVNQR
jgi:hypothetical protein